MKARSSYDDLGDLPDESAALVVRLRAAIDRLASRSRYQREAEAADGDPPHTRIPVLVGILVGLREDVRAGWMTSLEELVHAETFDDFLDMATELQAKNYKDAAAVIAGSVLEAHLRLLCSNTGIATDTPSGGHKKADLMNAELCKAGTYNSLQQKQVTAWLGIRNAAAHGEYGGYTADDVRALIPGVRDFLLRHPA